MRYKYTKGKVYGIGIQDTETKKFLKTDEILNLLNTLTKQNEDLKKENNYLHFQNKLHSQGVRYKTPFTRQKLYELGGVNYIRKIKQKTKTIHKTSKKIGCSTTLIYSFLRENGTSWSEI